MTPVIRAADSTVIAGEITHVFEYVSDLSTMGEWRTNVSDARLIAGREGETGAVYEYRVGRGASPVQTEVTAWDVPTRIELHRDGGPFPLSTELSFANGEQQTRITMQAEAHSGDWVTFVLFAAFKPLMRWLLKQQLRDELNRVKTAVETSASEPDE